MASERINAPDNPHSLVFVECVKQNELDDVKELLLKHSMNTANALSPTSNEFRNLIGDPQLLITKSHFIPKIYDAMSKLQTKIQENNPTSVKTVVISESENDVINGIKENLKILHALQIFKLKNLT
eukprot:171574_1